LTEMPIKSLETELITLLQPFLICYFLHHTFILTEQ